MKALPLWDPGKPIIDSVLEQDVYKFLMMYAIWRFYPNLRVKFQFMNRSKVPVGLYVDLDQLREEYEHTQTLTFTDSHIEHVRSLGLFPETFLEFLKTVRYPKIDITTTHDGRLFITSEGPWVTTTLCEMPVLAIVSELYTRRLIGDPHQMRAFREGETRLLQKIQLLKEYPTPFLQFGLRRRATGLWERHATRLFKEEVPRCLVGVSNVEVAREVEVEPKGTNAHELQMALYGLNRHISDEAVRRGQYKVFEIWEKCYGSQLLIMLTDTFGSPQLIDGLSEEHAQHWKGFRQDSGDPYFYAEQLVIPFYEKYGVDPRRMWCFFSDGLSFSKMREIHKHFSGKIQVGFGLGTNFTNDLGVFEPLPIVMKLVEAAGNPTVKLSDDPQKATGLKKEIEEAKRIFGSGGRVRQAVKA